MSTVTSIRKHSATRQPSTEKRKVTPRRRSNAALRSREYLTPQEVDRLIHAAGSVGRYGHRDARKSVYYEVIQTAMLRITHLRFPGGVRGAPGCWGCTPDSHSWPSR
jgi:hypothetical protein